MIYGINSPINHESENNFVYQMFFSRFIEFFHYLIDYEKLITILLFIQEGKTRLYKLTNHF